MTLPKILAIVMMMTILSSCDSIFTHCSANLSLEATNINKIKEYEGCEATVSGVITSTHIPADGKVAFINVGNSDYRKAFTIVIFRADFPKFNSLDNLEEYEGDFIQVHGTISVYRNRPQIIVNEPEQITLEVKL